MSISACIEARAGWRYGEAPRHWTWRGVGTDRCGGAGHRRIAIGGHSGGAVRATYAQATERFDNVAAVIAVSPGEYDHEGVIALHGESFSGPFRESERNIAEGQPDVLLRPGVPWGSTWSARAYVDCFNRDNRYSVTTHAANTGCPTLYVFGAEESAVGGPQEIPVVGAARRGLQAVGYSHVQVSVIDGANHGYMGREENLFYTMFNWLRGLQELVITPSWSPVRVCAKHGHKESRYC